MKTMIYKTLIFITILVVSCSGDDDTNSMNGLSGNWELSYYETTENGRIDYPNDGKPVILELKTNGTYEGRAGNNDIMGEYRTEEATIILSFYTTEITNTEWETLFHETLEIVREGNEYKFPYDLDGDNLVLGYGGNNSMHFIKR